MLHLGAPELTIVLVIVLLLFGVGRISNIAGELGKGIREFRSSLQGDGTAQEAKGMAQKAKVAMQGGTNE